MVPLTSRSPTETTPRTPVVGGVTSGLREALSRLSLTPTTMTTMTPTPREETVSPLPEFEAYARYGEEELDRMVREGAAHWEQVLGDPRGASLQLVIHGDTVSQEDRPYDPAPDLDTVTNAPCPEEELIPSCCGCGAQNVLTTDFWQGLPVCPGCNTVQG